MKPKANNATPRSASGEDFAAGGAEAVKPYDLQGDKGGQVERMFDSIAPRYDLMNALMSGGLHRVWLRRALAQVPPLGESARVLDVACGTGDVSFALARRFPHAFVQGVDLSEGMLSVARRRTARLDAATASRLAFTQGDCLALPWQDDTYDAVTVSYGVRNFSRLEQGYREMLRVLKPGGTLVVLELCEPTSPAMHFLYRLYTRTLVPLAGRIVSGDARAYSYLPESIAACPQRGAMTALMQRAGFTQTRYRALFPGAACLYTARKG